MQVNVVFIIAVIILMSHLIKGYHRGLVQILYSLLAITIALFVAYSLSPGLSQYLENNTKIYANLEDNCTNKVQSWVENHTDSQAQAGELLLGMAGVELPEGTLEAVLSGENELVTNMLEASGIYSEIGAKVANIIFTALVFMVIFIIIRIVLRLIFRVLNLAAHLPLIRVVNRWAGLIVGGLQGLIVLWILCLVFTVLGGTGLGTYVLAQINENAFLSWIYSNNPILYTII